VADVLRVVGLDHLSDRRATALSGGQQQRLALARALVNRPPALLLDEPLSNLDAKLRGELRAEMARIQREIGVTTIYVTHDQAEALAMSDTIAVMKDGLIEQVGSPQEVYHRPKSRFVAEFLGGANVLAGTVSQVYAARGAEQHCQVQTDAGQIVARAHEQMRVGDAVDVIARRESIGVLVDRSHPGEGQIAGRVVSQEFLGRSMAATVAVGDQLLDVEYANGVDAGVGSDVVLDFSDLPMAVLASAAPADAAA
jgi:ABC-type Fe3+/spermidine/putrescine transport system ATPase subunit